MLLVQEQQDSYEESRRKIARGAKSYVEAAIEGQQVELPTASAYRRWTDLVR